MSTLSVITPTGYRPEAFELCLEWMSRQTIKPDEWIIVTDSPLKLPLNDITRRTIIINGDGWKEGEDTQCRNMSKGLEAATGNVIAVFEDDDYYAPNYLEIMFKEFIKTPDLHLLGEYPAKYYHVKEKKWKIVKNNSYAALCQTFVNKKVANNILKPICNLGITPIDQQLWKTCKRSKLNIKKISHPKQLVYGIKGLPGRPGAGQGHNTKNYLDWQIDTGYKVLDEWLEEDSKYYKK